MLFQNNVHDGRKTSQEYRNILAMMRLYELMKANILMSHENHRVRTSPRQTMCRLARNKVASSFLWKIANSTVLDKFLIMQKFN
jgi:hypothetical protein